MTKPTQNSELGNSLQLKIAQQGQQHLSTHVLAGVFSALNCALESFLLVEILQHHSHPKPALKKEIVRFVSENGLIMSGADLVRATFTFELGQLINEPGFRLLKDIPELQQQLFALFIQTIFTPALFTSAHIEKLTERYQAKERARIFGPVYDHLVNPGQRYQVYFAVVKGRAFETWIPPEDEQTRSRLIPEVIKKAGEQQETYYQYIKTGEVNDLFGKRSKYEKVLIKESAKHDVYPYQLQKIRVKGKSYRFSGTLAASVKVENGLYRITLPELQLSVSHQDRSGAEKEFDAALAQLIGQLEKADSIMNLKSRSALIKLKELLLDA